MKQLKYMEIIYRLIKPLVVLIGEIWRKRTPFQFFLPGSLSSQVVRFPFVLSPHTGNLPEDIRERELDDVFSKVRYEDVLLQGFFGFR